MSETSPKANIFIESMSAIFIIVFVAFFILVNLFYGFVWPLYVVTMIFAFLISARYPKSGLFAIVFLTIIFERFFTLQGFFIGKAEYKLYPLDIIMLGIIFGILTQHIFGRIRKLQLQKNDHILILFVFLNIIYFFYSILFMSSIDSAVAFSSLKNYGFYSLLYFITIFLIRSKDDLCRLGRFFLAGAVGIIIFIVIGVLRGQGLWSEFTPLSTSGVRLLAFTHGLYLSLAIIPVVLYRIFTKSKQAFSWFDLLIVIWIFGIIATLMRHLWIALALVFLLVYFLIPKEIKDGLQKISGRYMAILIVMIVSVFYITSLNPQSELNEKIGAATGVVAERTSSLGSISQDESYFWRTLVWKSAYADFQKNPIFGLSTGKKVFVDDGRAYRDFVEIRNIHNSYLAILIQFGFFGAIVLLYFIYQNWMDLLKAYKKNENDWQKLAVLAMLTLFLVAFFFQPYLETNVLSIFFWIALGISRNMKYENIGNQQI